MKNKRVLKFGGTSMGSVNSLTNVMEIIRKNHQQGIAQVIVCSAMNGVTDLLLSCKPLAENGKSQEAMDVLERLKERHQVTAVHFGVQDQFDIAAKGHWEDLRSFIKGICMIREVSERSHAYLLSFGEELSTRLLTAILQKNGIPAVQRDSTFVKTLEGSFIEGEVDWAQTKEQVKKELMPHLNKKEIPIVTGFFGTDPDGLYALMGRGASDLSGAIMAVSLEIPDCEIWTDVDGFLTADPRLVPDAKIIPEIGYEEVAELCFFGAKVLHPKTIRPVIDAGGTVYIRNTFAPENPGTRIVRKSAEGSAVVQAITSKKVSVVMFDVFASGKRKREVLADFFSFAAREEICIDAIASSEASVSVCLDDKFFSNKRLLQDLEKIAPLRVLRDRKIICTVGSACAKGNIGEAAYFFQALADEGINIEMYSMSAAEVTQLVVIKAEEGDRGVRAVHGRMMNKTCREDF